MTSFWSECLLSWLGTGQPAGPTLVAATLTQPVRLEPQQPSATYRFELNKKQAAPWTSHPFDHKEVKKILSQKVLVLTLDVSGLVPFSKDAKEPFFSSTWDEFDQMRNQVPKQLDALLKKNGGCAMIQNHIWTDMMVYLLRFHIDVITTWIQLNISAALH